MTSTAPNRLRDVGIVALALVLASLGANPVLAADSQKAPAERKASASESTGSSDSTSDTPAGQAAPVPQAQIDDEGPSARVAKKVHHGFKTPPAASDVEEKPYWKSAVFWGVTGALVAGSVAAFIYSFSGSRGAAGPCPGDISLSLGCFGAGRM